MTLDSFNAFTVTVTPRSVLWKYTQVYFTNTCKNEQTTFVNKWVYGSFVLWLRLKEVYKYEIHASSFHIFSGTTKKLNCSKYGNNFLTLAPSLSVVRIAP